MNKKIHLFSQGIILILAILGLVVVSMTAHELKHVVDYKGDVDEICVLNLPTSLTLDFPLGYIIGRGESDEASTESFTVFVAMLFLIITKLYIEGWD